MNEFKRLYGIKALILLVALAVINIGLFMMSCAPEKAITLTDESLDAYIAEYPEFLNRTKENSKTLSALNMYKSGFAADNIRKSTEAYAGLENISVKSGENRGIVLFAEYGLTDIFLIAFLMIMSVQMLSERRKGLANLIRSTKKGRAVLYFQRVSILVVSSIIAGILLYGGNLLGMILAFGKTDLSRSIQSIPEFMQCPYPLAIGDYLLLSCIIKTAVCFAASLAFFLVLCLFGTGLTYTLTAIFTVAELLLFNAIMPVSSINILKYINIFAMLKCMDIFSICCNIDIFGKAFSVLKCNAVFLSASSVILIISGFIVSGKYIQSRNPLEGTINKISAVSEKIAFQRTLFGWESFKLLIKQGGIFFIAASFLLTLSSSLKYDYAYDINYLEEEYYEKYNDEITEELFLSAENELSAIKSSIEFYRKQINEMLERGHFSDDAMKMRMGDLESAERKRDALVHVIFDIQDGMEYTQRTGNRIILVKPYAYDLLLNCDMRTQSRASLYILIGIIGAVSGIFAYDEQNNMQNTLASSYRGRGMLKSAKIGVVFIVCVMLCISVHLIQFVQIGKFLGYNDISAPVQSLGFMRDFGIYTSIWGYIALLFSTRAAAAFVTGLICVAVSRICADTASAMGVSIFVLAIPAVFSEIIPSMNFINCVYLISGQYLR